MNWMSLLSATARLVDIHDSARAAGTVPSSPSEERPGVADGVWVDIATRLLEYLHERDLEANEAWIPISAFVDDMTKRHAIAEDDVRFVINFLTTPTRLTNIKEAEALDGPLAVQTTKDTALVEWPRNTNIYDRCRLSRMGHRSVQLSKASDDWLYAANDAEKLITAIEYGAFSQFPTIAKNIVGQVRGFTKDIVHLLERQGMEDLLEEFRARKEDYLQILQRVQRAVETADHRFSAKDIRDRFEAWYFSHDDPPTTASDIRRSLHEILQSLERLNRQFQDLISSVVLQRREIIGGVRFDEAALRLAFFSCDEATVLQCMHTLGPWFTDICLPSADDFDGVLSINLAENNQRSMIFDDELEPALPEPIALFIEKYGESIRQALSEGSVSLSTAIGKGWIDIAGVSALTQLVGVYSAPDLLEATGQRISIHFERGSLRTNLSDGKILKGDNLVMALIPVQQEGEENYAN